MTKAILKELLKMTTSFPKKSRFTTPYSSQTCSNLKEYSTNSSPTSSQPSLVEQTTTSEEDCLPLSGYFSKKKNSPSASRAHLFPKVTPHTRVTIRKRLAKSIKEKPVQLNNPCNESPAISVRFDLSQKSQDPLNVCYNTTDKTDVSTTEASPTATRETGGDNCTYTASKKTHATCQQKDAAAPKTTQRVHHVSQVRRLKNLGPTIVSMVTADQGQCQEQIVPTASEVFGDVQRDGHIYEYASNPSAEEHVSKQSKKRRAKKSSFAQRRLIRELVKQQVLKTIFKMKYQMEEIQRRRLDVEYRKNY